jgi:MSHA biogenesis protein MshL
LSLDFPDFNAFIDLLQAQGNTRVLSSPRVATLNNQKAVIKAGSDEFFVTDISNNTVTGTASTSNSNVELTPFFSGIALDVTPQISEDGIVTLHIHPTVSDVRDQTKTITVGKDVNTLPLAFSEIRESDSIVRARSGQVIVIGGLMRNTRRRQDFRTPFLGAIPGLGNLFKSQRNLDKKTELVILLRPLVVDDQQWDSIAAADTKRAEDLAKQGKVSE